MKRKLCKYCATFFFSNDSDILCDLCIDEGISLIDDDIPVTVGGFPVNPVNSTRTIASCTHLDHAPIGSSRDDYFEFRRDLARKYDKHNKGYADMSDFEDLVPYDSSNPCAADDVIYNIVAKCVEIRKNNTL